jgi:hypothetical protein
MAPNERLPIKVVLPVVADRKTKRGGGSKARLFDDVDAARERVGAHLATFATTFAKSLSAAPDLPVVARLTLKREALAKSHSPAEFLAEVGAKVIGNGRLGELLVGFQSDALSSLRSEAARTQEHRSVAALTTIDRIEPFVAFSTLSDTSDELVEEALGKSDRALKLRLFTYSDRRADEAVEQALFSQVRMHRAEIGSVHYADKVRVYRIGGATVALARSLRGFVGTQSFDPFPRYRIIRGSGLRCAPGGKELPPPDEGVQYPVVGLIDSGISPGGPLEPWIVKRYSFVPKGFEDFTHGTFVGGLLVFPRALNGDDTRFPEGSCRVIDVTAFDREGDIGEDVLLSILQEVVPKHPDVRVWNLSLSSDQLCTDESFSDFALALDDLQSRHGVTFVLAAGNVSTTPIRTWPPQQADPAHRITAPADSIRGLTVGSLAHRHHDRSCSRTEEPSGFSRCGPGPAALPKPEIVHFGGNCDSTGQYLQTGVVSLSPSGDRAEMIGTSFATPLVSNVLGNVHGSFAKTCSRALAKALVIQSATLRSPTLASAELRYKGFGLPAPIDDILYCQSSWATLVFEPSIPVGKNYVKQSFPIPVCMQTSGGAFKGEIVMTLAYDPPLDASQGAQYCQMNVEASLGVLKRGKKGTLTQCGLVKTIPRDARLLSEKELIAHGFKWSPVKVYRLKPSRGVSGEPWQLQLTLTPRSEVTEAQSVALVITLRSDDPSAPVYDQVVQLMNRNGWITSNLDLRARTRIAS